MVSMRVSVIVLWICSLTSCQDVGQQFVWLPYEPVAVGGSGNDGIISSELAEGESVTIKSSLDDERQQHPNEDQFGNQPRHELVHAENGTNWEHEQPSIDDRQVQVQEWIATTTPANDDLINKANEVSAPWYDVMLAGLPPAVAYDWRFLVDMTKKLKTAPRGDNQDDSRTIYKYLLKRVTEATTPKGAKLDVLKQNHHLKAKMHQSNQDEALIWAWKRTQPLQ